MPNVCAKATAAQQLQASRRGNRRGQDGASAEDVCHTSRRRVYTGWGGGGRGGEGGGEQVATSDTSHIGRLHARPDTHLVVHTVAVQACRYIARGRGKTHTHWRGLPGRKTKERGGKGSGQRGHGAHADSGRRMAPESGRGGRRRADRCKQQNSQGRSVKDALALGLPSCASSCATLS